MVKPQALRRSKWEREMEKSFEFAIARWLAKEHHDLARFDRDWQQSPSPGGADDNFKHYIGKAYCLIEAINNAGYEILEIQEEEQPND